jgi:hypothetical protein
MYFFFFTLCYTATTCQILFAFKRIFGSQRVFNWIGRSLHKINKGILLSIFTQLLEEVLLLSVSLLNYLFIYYESFLVRSVQVEILERPKRSIFRKT